MQVQIQVKGLPRSAQLRKFALHKLKIASCHFSHIINGATMCLSDINGSERGGVDKLCRVVLHMKNDAIVIVEELAPDIAQAIDHVTHRLHQSVSRQLCQLDKMDRSGMGLNSLALART